MNDLSSFYYFVSTSLLHLLPAIKVETRRPSVCVEDAEDFVPFVNHSAGGEHFYVCDLSYGGNCSSTSDETECSAIKAGKPILKNGEKRCGTSVTVTCGNVGEKK